MSPCHKLFDSGLNHYQGTSIQAARKIMSEISCHVLTIRLRLYVFFFFVCVINELDQ